MSILRHYAQIPTQVKYITTSTSVVVNTPGNLSSTTVNAIKFPPGMAPADFIIDKYVDSSSNPALFNLSAYTTFNPFLLKDMGRQLTVLGQYNNHVALFREAQLQQSGSTEGVGGGPTDGYGSVWVKVWSPISKVAFSRGG